MDEEGWRYDAHGRVTLQHIHRVEAVCRKVSNDVANNKQPSLTPSGYPIGVRHPKLTNV